MEIRDVIEDEMDPDWSFVPMAMLLHNKRVIPRYVVINHDKENKPILTVTQNAHLRLKILWKDGTISWNTGNAMQLKNPFIFIPYVVKNKLTNNNDFRWIKEYLPLKENINLYIKHLKQFFIQVMMGNSSHFS